MLLREEHFLGRTLDGAPLADVALQRSQHVVTELIGMVVLELAQQRDRHQLGRALQQRNDLGVPYVGEWIGARTSITPGRLRRQRRIAIDTARAALADTGLGGRQ